MKNKYDENSDSVRKENLQTSDKKSAIKVLQKLIDALNATEFPMNVWERATFDMMVKLKEAKEKAEEYLSVPLESDETSIQDPKETEWISVNRELPKDGLDVFVCKNGIPMLLSHYLRHGDWFGYGESQATEWITHWMDIPKNPPPNLNNKPQ